MQVNQRTAAFLGDAPHRGVNYGPALAASRAEDITHEAVRVHTHEDGPFTRVLDVALHHRDVRIAIDLRLIRDHAELSVRGWHDGLGHPPNVALVRHAIADEFGYSQHLQIVLPAELSQLG